MFHRVRFFVASFKYPIATWDNCPVKTISSLFDQFLTHNWDSWSWQNCSTNAWRRTILINSKNICNNSQVENISLLTTVQPRKLLTWHSQCRVGQPCSLPLILSVTALLSLLDNFALYKHCGLIAVSIWYVNYNQVSHRHMSLAQLQPESQLHQGWVNIKIPVEILSGNWITFVRLFIHIEIQNNFPTPTPTCEAVSDELNLSAVSV